MSDFRREDSVSVLQGATRVVKGGGQGKGYRTKGNFRLVQTLKLVVIQHKRLHPTSLNPTKKSQFCGNRDYGMFSKLSCKGRGCLSVGSIQAEVWSLYPSGEQSWMKGWAHVPLTLRTWCIYVWRKRSRFPHLRAEWGCHGMMESVSWTLLGV